MNTVTSAIVDSLKSLKGFTATTKSKLPVLEFIQVIIEDGHIVMQATNRQIMARIEGPMISNDGESFAGLLRNKEVARLDTWRKANIAPILELSKDGIGRQGDVIIGWDDAPTYPTDLGRLIPSNTESGIHSGSSILSADYLSKLAQIRLPEERPVDAKNAGWVAATSAGKSPVVWTRDLLDWEATVLMMPRKG